MRTVLVVISVLSCSLAGAIENVFQTVEEAKAKSPIVISFRVTDVHYEQKGELLYTNAEAEVLSVERGDISAGSTVSITYSSNFVGQARQVEAREQTRQPGKAIELVTPRLLEGQTATGWFNLGTAGDILIPALGFDSFENTELPEIQIAELAQEFTVAPGQVVRFSDVDLELRVVQVEWVSACPPGATCVIGGHFVPQVDVISGGRHQSILLNLRHAAVIETAGVTIDVRRLDQRSSATIVVSAIK